MEKWINKYHVSNIQLGYFVTEQDYVDYEFIWIIYYNFGVALEQSKFAEKDLTKG